MASSSDEQPKPPEPPAATMAVPAAVPQSHAEWASSVQAFYASGGHPYAAWPAQVRSVTSRVLVSMASKVP
jgi:plant G-box-binding factor